MISYVRIFHKARQILPLILNYLAVNRLLIFSTEGLPLIFTGGALPTFIHGFPIKQNFQLRIYNNIRKEITFIKFYYIPVVKALMSNNRHTCPSVLGDLRRTQRGEFFVI